MTRRAKVVLVAVNLVMLAAIALATTALVSSFRADDRQRPPGWTPIDLPGSDAATWCDHGNRLYQNRSNGNLTAVRQDPTCPKETK